MTPEHYVTSCSIKAFLRDSPEINILNFLIKRTIKDCASCYPARYRLKILSLDMKLRIFGFVYMSYKSMYR